MMNAFNNGMMNPGYGYGIGVMPNQQQMPKMGNWLSNDKYNLLQKGLGQFKLSVTDEEVARGQCNHYNQNGTSALVPDADGSGGYTCSICGTHFHYAEYAKEDVEAATQNILDILNLIKTMYVSIDPGAALEYFQIIPFIEKIPQLYNIAMADFNKYEQVTGFTPTNQVNPFNMFGIMMGQPMGFQNGMAMNGMPNMNMAAQNPMAAQQTGFNPLYAQPGMMAGMANPAMGYQPQQNGYAFNPQGGATVNTNMPVQPQTAAPAATTATPAPAAAPAVVDTAFKK